MTVSLQLRGLVALPAHRAAGGFDHAAVHGSTGLIYVAHTANDAVDVIDPARGEYVRSIEGCPAVAGALVIDRPDLVVTTNRGDNTIGLFEPGATGGVDTVSVGVRPNGAAYDTRRARLLVAHVGDPAVPGSHTVAVVDVHARKVVAELPVAGRTRWTVYDPAADAFHVNIMDPPQIVVVGAADPVGIRRIVPIGHAGPHGLDIDVARRRLYCACDAGVLLELDADSGVQTASAPIAGPPDVVFFNPSLDRLYVAIGEPGVLEVFDTAPLRRHETIVTERGAHTLAFDAARSLVGVFLPETHRVSLYDDVR